MSGHTTDTTILDPLSPDSEGSPEEERAAAACADRFKSEPRPRLAEILARMGFRQPALKILQNQLIATSDPATHAQCYFVAGKIREHLGQFEAASRCYGAVATEQLEAEDRYLALNNFGYCLNRLGRHAEAETACRQAVAIDATRFNAHKNLGIALERTGRLSEAAAAYRTAANANTSDDRALRHLRVLLANHPEVARDQPDLVHEIESLRRSSREGRRQTVPEYSGPSQEDVRTLLKGVRVAEEITASGIQVFGLYWDRSKPIDYATLDEALSGGLMEITEVSEQGSVPTLHVVNRSERLVFLMAGEQLVGAKQNRVLNTSVMVGSHAEVPMPVTCVEQGRWRYRSRSFSTAGTSAHHALRVMMSKHVHASYKRGGRPDSDQGEVWREVTRKLRAFQTHSPSHALHDVYESSETRLKEIHDRLAPRENWSGALFGFGGSIIGLDLFDKPATLRKLWPKLLRAYAIDALESGRAGRVERSEAEAWVRDLSRTAIESFASMGVGTDVRMEGDRLLAAMLLVDEAPVHVEAFADEND